MTIKEQLYKKLSAEYDSFIDDLKGAPPDKIIDSAYEKVFKEDILSCFEYGGSFSEQQIAALLALDYPLDALYRNWLDTDVSHMDDLSDTIFSFTMREIQEQNGIDGEKTAGATPVRKTVPKRALGEKLHAAGEKVKAQDAPGNNNKSRKREER